MKFASHTALNFAQNTDAERLTDTHARTRLGDTLLPLTHTPIHHLQPQILSPIPIICTDTNAQCMQE